MSDDGSDDDDNDNDDDDDNDNDDDDDNGNDDEDERTLNIPVYLKISASLRVDKDACVYSAINAESTNKGATTINLSIARVATLRRSL